MEIHRSFDINKKIKNPVVTTGSFDGVHIGHKTILQRLKKIANEIDGETVLITFYPHPRKVLYPETHGKNLKLISTQREKIFLLEQAGLDHLIIVNFTREFAKTTSHQFVEDILVGKLDARRIIVGFNHHFGHNREGDYEYLYELAKTHDFEVEEIPEQDVENETVSSTTIRQALSEGKIQRANAYLDHYYIIMGKLRDGHPKCREVGFPTYEVEIEEKEKLIPPEGVYAVSMMHEKGRYKGMLNIKKYPDRDNLTVEVHVFGLDHEFDFRGEMVKIQFHKKIRNELNFNNTKAFHKQLNIDMQNIEELIF
ncbi:MAG: riboflavin biosynthesis protein RibF [Bacteroidales bacterium]